MKCRTWTTVAVLLLAALTSHDSLADKEPAADDLIKVELATIVPDEQTRTVMLVLKPEEGYSPANDPGARRVLPMVIGFEEARSIYVAFKQFSVPRPLSHDLMKTIIEKCDGAVVSCVITKMEQESFIAELHLKRAGREIVIDCRPSDGLALSLRSGTPVYARRAVLDEHAIDPAKPDQAEKPVKT